MLHTAAPFKLPPATAVRAAGHRWTLLPITARLLLRVGTIIRHAYAPSSRLMNIITTILFHKMTVAAHAFGML